MTYCQTNTQSAKTAALANYPKRFAKNSKYSFRLGRAHVYRTSLHFTSLAGGLSYDTEGDARRKN